MKAAKAIDKARAKSKKYLEDVKIKLKKLKQKGGDDPGYLDALRKQEMEELLEAMRKKYPPVQQSVQKPVQDPVRDTDGILLLNKSLSDFINNDAKNPNRIEALRIMAGIINAFIGKRHCKIEDFTWFASKISPTVTQQIETRFGFILKERLQQIAAEYYRLPDTQFRSNKRCQYNDEDLVMS